MTSVAKPPTSNRCKRTVSPRRSSIRMPARRSDSSPQSPGKSVSSSQSIPTPSSHRHALNSSNHSVGDIRMTMTRAKTNRRASLDGAAMHSRMRGDDESKKANRPVISPLLRATHKKLKEQIGKIQEQIRFIQNVATMNDNKKIETLFELIDCGGDGSVDASELAKAMRQNDELSFPESIEKAIDMVAKFDTNGDGELDKSEFYAYVEAMVQELNLSCSEFCELIILQLLLGGGDDVSKEDGTVDKENISEEVKKRKGFYVFINDNKEDLEELFDLFKAKKSSEQVKFVDVARAFANCDIIKNANKRFGVADSLEVLLMTSAKDKRMLDFKQFGRLVLSVVTTSRKSFDDVADSLFDSVKSESTWDVDYDHSTVGTPITGVDELTNNRLKKLFQLWDADGDGDISKEELSNGLDHFQSATGMKGDTSAIAKALISFDTDGDNQLDPREFSEAIFQYAKITGVELNVLIDFMCITSSVEQSKRLKADFPEFNEEDFEETEFEYCE